MVSPEALPGVSMVRPCCPFGQCEVVCFLIGRRAVAVSCPAMMEMSLYSMPRSVNFRGIARW